MAYLRFVVGDIDEGKKLPWGFGLAYRSPLIKASVYWRWPLNHVVAQWRRFWWWARDARIMEAHRTIDMVIIEARREARSHGYSQGYERGHTDGYQKGVAAERARIQTGLAAFGAERSAKFLKGE